MECTWCFCNIGIAHLKELDTVDRFLDYANILETEKLDGFILEKNCYFTTFNIMTTSLSLN